MTFSAARTNRPFKFGPNDRREFIVQDSEVALQVEYDGNNNAIYIGRARIGTATSEAYWQIQALSYDGNDNLTDITWPQNSQGNPSGEYEFEWDERATYTYG